ncbi:lipopolysaccharide-binding protein-like [Argonauta hians]
MILKTVLVCLAAIFVNCIVATTENPGVKLELTEKAFTSATETGLLIAKQAIVNQKIPDQSGRYGIISYRVYRMEVKDLSYGTPSVKFVPGKGVRFMLPKFHIAMTGRLTARSGFLHKSFSFDMDASNIAIGFFLHFGDNVKTKKISALVDQCTSSVPVPKITFHGGGSSIINSLSGYFGKKLRDTIKQKICSSYTLHGINHELEKIISEMPNNVHFWNSFYLNINLLKQPTTNSSLLTLLKGEVFWIQDVRECPLPVRPMENIPEDTKQTMMTLQVSPYTLNTFAYVAHKHKILRKTLTTKNMPSKGILNTTCTNSVCIGNLIPEIGKLYPHQKLSIFIESTKMPDVDIKSGTIYMDVFISLTIYLSTDTPNKPLLILPLTIRSAGAVNIRKQVFHHKLSKFDITLGVIRKGLPIKINEKQFQGTLNLFATLFILPYINEKGAEGYPLSSLFTLQRVNNTRLELGLNSAMLFTDISLIPIDADDNLSHSIMRMIRSYLVMPSFSFTNSIFTALHMSFSDDPESLYQQDIFIDSVNIYL